ncbi:MAG: hypothetical protein NZ561_08805 [Phycisphaerae bacterium]|nr:hypothetical protein [Phycisphaerae bacterium]MDW8262705.1 CpsB/CapC family capsule biosynthesis tyrosine phosphatase [Phycisphaerales bacterium]
MRSGRVDPHCHLLPGVDDGCANLPESIECARRLLEAGYSHVCCTPHIWPSLVQNTMENILQWTADLQRELHDRNIPLTLHAGGEINLLPSFSTTDPAKVVTYGGRRRHVLFDLWADVLPPHFEASVKWLQQQGLQPILAHPERMRAVQDDPCIVEYFAELGLWLQGNLQCFGDPPDSATRRLAERFLEENRYFCLGSDCHGPSSLEIRLEGLKNALQLAGQERINRLTIENPSVLLG